MGPTTWTVVFISSSLTRFTARTNIVYVVPAWTGQTPFWWNIHKNIWIVRRKWYRNLREVPPDPVMIVVHARPPHPPILIDELPLVVNMWPGRHWCVEERDGVGDHVERDHRPPVLDRETWLPRQPRVKQPWIETGGEKRRHKARRGSRWMNKRQWMFRNWAQRGLGHTLQIADFLIFSNGSDEIFF